MVESRYAAPFSESALSKRAVILIALNCSGCTIAPACTGCTPETVSMRAAPFAGSVSHVFVSFIRSLVKQETQLVYSTVSPITSRPIILLDFSLPASSASTPLQPFSSCTVKTSSSGGWGKSSSITASMYATP